MSVNFEVYDTVLHPEHYHESLDPTFERRSFKSPLRFDCQGSLEFVYAEDGYVEPGVHMRSVRTTSSTSKGRSPWLSDGNQ